MRKMLGLLLVLLLVFQSSVCVADASESLTVSQGSYDSESESIVHFVAEHPTVQLKYETVPDIFGWLIEQLANRNDQVDIYRFSSETNLSTKLIALGYAKKITVSESQTAVIDQFYPAFKNGIMEDDNLYFVPTAIHFPYLFTFNQQVFDTTGISTDEIPQNIEELFDFIDKWNTEYAFDYPEITPFFAHGFGYSDINDYVGLLIDVYVDSQIFTYGTLSFDTELFRSLLCRVKSYNKASTTQQAQNQVFDEPQQQDCLIYCKRVNTSEILDQTMNKSIRPLSIAQGYPAYQPFSMEYSFINPFSQNRTTADAFLSSYLDDPDPLLLCILSKELATPLESSTYAENHAEWLAILDDANARLKYATPSEKTEPLETIATTQDFLNNEDLYRYRVSPSDLEQYQKEIVPYLVNRGGSSYNSQLMKDTIEMNILRYLQSSIDIETLVRILDQSVSLSYNEDK